MLAFFKRYMTLAFFAEIVKITRRDVLLAITQPALTEREATALATISTPNGISNLSVSAPHGMILRETLDHTAERLLTGVSLRGFLHLALWCVRHQKTRNSDQETLREIDHALYDMAGFGVHISLTCNPTVGWSSVTGSRQCNGHRHGARLLHTADAERLLSGILQTIRL